MKRPKILLTNDDGIHAPGIRHLWNALKRANFADLCVIAPLTEMSGTGASITWDRPILIQNIDWDETTPAWAVDGTPADCVKMGVRIILNSPPDFIVSGINAGSNAGRNVLHSGTIGAVIEGVFRGIPGIAFSCESDTNPGFPLVEEYIPSLVEYVLQNPLHPGSFLNVNFPESITRGNFKGCRMTRQGKGRWLEDPYLHFESDQGKSYWLGGKPEESIEDGESDISLLRQGYMTVVPIHVHELTEREVLKQRKGDFESFFQNGSVEPR